jgi:hypothetical protein
MWDGNTYENNDKAAAAAATYKEDGFEVETLADGEVHLVFTRRLAAVEGNG